MVTRRQQRGFTTVGRRLHDGFTTFTRRLHGGYITVKIRLHDGCMTTTRPLHDGYTTDQRPFHDGYTTATRRLYDKYTTEHDRLDIRRVHNGYTLQAAYRRYRRCARALPRLYTAHVFDARYYYVRKCKGCWVLNTHTETILICMDLIISPEHHPRPVPCQYVSD